MNLDPRIGRLNSGKFYAFVDGYDKPEFVGTLEEVEVRLGLRQPTTAAKRAVAAPRLVLRDYEVTVTPKVIVYSGGGYTGKAQTFGEYVVRVSARTNSEAITKVRRQLNEVEGRCGIKATYRARRV